mgnify:CR=1 FL=1
MKTTITIETDNRMSLDKILESFRMTKGVKKVEASEPEQTLGIPCTQDELIEAVERSKADIKAGRVTRHADLKKERTSWK